MSWLDGIKDLFATPDERLAHAVARIPHASIASAAEGALVRVVGRVVSDAIMTAPFTGRRVVWFHCRYESRHRNDDENALIATVGVLARNHKPAEWVTELAAGDGHPFFVDDGSGVLASVTGARVIAPELRVHETRFLDAEPDAFRAFMNAHGKITTAYMGADVEKRFYEQAVCVGDTIAVAGIARHAAGAPRDAGYRQNPTTIVVLESPCASAETE